MRWMTVSRGYPLKMDFVLGDAHHLVVGAFGGEQKAAFGILDAPFSSAGSPHSRKKRDGKPDLYTCCYWPEHVGYRNLMAIVSEAAVSGFYYKLRST